ncbi:hypothetical protein CRG98_007323 [Punica granatum]|uniref:Uncharacterized protein n=1 Tax=Punica granatum TaxID=22663 RepID=A0A2I0KUT9_PUNGR|nr:hypothetical protein CRG98_007323 [Punica granatum]
MFYLASGYEVRVGEVFESRETRLNAWKGARVQRMHVRARMGARGAREHVGLARGWRTCARACTQLAYVRDSARGGQTCARARGCARVLFTREHGLRPK